MSCLNRRRVVQQISALKAWEPPWIEPISSADPNSFFSPVVLSWIMSPKIDYLHLNFFSTVWALKKIWFWNLSNWFYNLHAILFLCVCLWLLQNFVKLKRVNPSALWSVKRVGWARSSLSVSLSLSFVKYKRTDEWQNCVFICIVVEPSPSTAALYPHIGECSHSWNFHSVRVDRLIEIHWFLTTTL